MRSSTNRCGCGYSIRGAQHRCINPHHPRRPLCPECQSHEVHVQCGLLNEFCCENRHVFKLRETQPGPSALRL